VTARGAIGIIALGTTPYDLDILHCCIRNGFIYRLHRRNAQKTHVTTMHQTEYIAENKALYLVLRKMDRPCSRIITLCVWGGN